MRTPQRDVEGVDAESGKSTRSEVATDHRRAAAAVKRRLDPLTTLVVAITAVFALAGIGTPLLGLRVFADPGSLAQYSPYSDVLAGVTVHTENQRDITDNVLPVAQFFHNALWDGDLPLWNPYTLGGEPFATLPNSGLNSPLSLPYWLLPTWLAPGYVKLLELICAVGGMVLFLRRLGLGRPASWLGGIVFAGSGFMVVWTNWPQTRVAALIPALFWAIERLLQQRRVRVRDVFLLSLPVAGMLLGGFPAVAGYALVTAAAYAVVRVWPTARSRVKPAIGRLAAIGGGVVAGVGLTAFQLVPFAEYMTTVLTKGRAQDSTQHLSPSSLLTLVNPYALGTADPGQPPTWFADHEIVAAQSYLGAAAMVLVLTSIALAGQGRRLLPRGIWWTFVASTAAWISVIYFGSPMLVGLQHTGFLFSDNFIGRARCVLGFLMGALAAVGFELVLRRRRAPSPQLARRRGQIIYAWAVWVVAAGAGIILYLAARSIALKAGHKDGQDYVSYLNSQLLIAAAMVTVAGGAVAWLWFGPMRSTRQRRLRWAALAVLPVLIAGQSLAFAVTYFPRTDKSEFYPTTPTQTYLAAHLGHERYFGADPAIYGSVDITYPLRSLQGHSFLQSSLADLVDTLPGQQFSVPATAIQSKASGVGTTSSVLDRAAVAYYLAPPEVPAFGAAEAEPSDGQLSVRSGQTEGLTTTVRGPLRGLGVLPLSVGDAAPVDARLSVSVSDASGTVIGQGELDGAAVEAGTPWVVPLAAEDVSADTVLTATVNVTGAPGLELAAAGARPALEYVRPGDDGLRLVYAGATTIYERLNALPRARWASSARVVTDPAQRISLLSDDRVPRDQVILSAPGPAASGLPADVEWQKDGTDDMVLSVDAQGSGYLVIADTIQNGWRATIDGVPATIVAADHAFAAVNVPAGQHTVRLWYGAPWTAPGTLMTGATLLLFPIAAAGASWLRRRRDPIG